MSTFLELVVELQEESGSSGDKITSVVGQSGENQRMVKWIRNSDMYVQNLWLNWKFLWTQVTVSTGIGVGLAAPTNLNFWDYKTFKINDGGVGDLDEPIDVVEHDATKTMLRDTNTNKPSNVIVMPDNSLDFDPPTDAVYKISADYFKRPTPMTANADVSLIPENFHQVILGRALTLYANYESSSEIKVQGQEIYDEVIGRLENSQLPNQRFSRFQSTGSYFDVNANENGGDNFVVGGDGSW